MNKKAQIKIFENIGVLLMFFVLVIIAIIFYFVFSRGELEEAKVEFGAQNAVELSSKIALLPELQCRKNNAQEDHCFDEFKIKALESTLQDPAAQETYFDIFGYSTIQVTSIYPKTPSQLSITLYNNTKEDFGNKDTFFIPISVFDPAEEIHSYGLLEVNVYT